ncbi:MAG: MaoC family dehydratase N-terminal domain-containing protein [Chloroflexota bacterium]
MNKLNMDLLNQWLGKEETTKTVLAVETADLMNATLNRPAKFKKGDELPPAWHWLYFHEPVVGDKLGVEGHPELGQFMPPVSFGGGLPPRRMWAGGKLVWKRPLRLGDYASKTSRIKSIVEKNGRSGALCFVLVEHEISVGGNVCLQEEQTIVYREPVQAGGKAAQASPAPTNADFSASHTPDPIMLFRYSALTFNGHRIHYDVDFCREHEGYPGLVVHGPLIATLLLDLFYQQGRQISEFSYRGRSPLFNPNPFSVHGTADGQAWASNYAGGLAMTAQIK